MINMTPQEKANELFTAYLNVGMGNGWAKQCALIAVDEIINAETYIWGGYNRNEYKNYFQAVKEEIEKL